MGTTASYHLSPTGQLQKHQQNRTILNAEDVEKLESLCLVDRNVNYYSLVWKDWGCSSVVQHLPSMLEALGSVFTTATRKEERKDGKKWYGSSENN